MKFPIGTSFIHGFLCYLVVGYDSSLYRPYVVRVWADGDEEDFDLIEMTEGELEISINR